MTKANESIVASGIKLIILFFIFNSFVCVRVRVSLFYV